MTNPTLQQSNRLYQRADHLESASALGDTVLLAINPATGDVDGNYILNELSSRVWDLLNGHNTVADICTVIVSEYAADFATVFSDVADLLEDWHRAGLVTEL